MKEEKDIYITASEMGDFIYCKRGWWLRFNNKIEPTERMIEGGRKHDEIATQIQTTSRKLSIAKYMIIFGALCLIALILYTFFVT